MRPSMENHELVSSFQNITPCHTHPRLPKCDRGFPVQIDSNSVNGVVTTPSSVQKNLQKVVHSASRSVCHTSKPQVTTVRLPSTRSKRMEQKVSPLFHSGRVTQKVRQYNCLLILIVVLGSGASISGNSASAACISNSTQTIKQPGVSRQSAISQPPCLVSRSEQLQEQGFSTEVAEIIAAPQRPSTRAIYQEKWSLFEKWCRENLVDVSKPSVKQVSNFFMHLFQDLNRRPSTIDGYRTVILDALGPAGLHIAQSTDLNRLITSFH